MEEEIDLKYIKDYNTSDLDTIIQTLVSDEAFRHRMNAMLEDYFHSRKSKVKLEFDDKDLHLTVLKSMQFAGGNEIFTIPPCAIQIDSKEELLFG